MKKNFNFLNTYKKEKKLNLHIFSEEMTSWTALTMHAGMKRTFCKIYMYKAKMFEIYYDAFCLS